MATIKAQFGVLVSELDPNGQPSGTADTVLNVVRTGQTLEGRKGFDEFDAAGTTPILNLACAHFANGETYVVKKLNTGILWYMKTYPAAGNWTQIADKFSGHSTTDRGWFYFWADRLYYFDSKGGTKWGPNDSGTMTAWKAGLAATVRPEVAAAAGGGKEGVYHVYAATKNSKTNEISQVSQPAAGISTWLSQTATGGTGVGGAWYCTNWSAVKADTNYEYDTVVFYSTKGDTEFIALGAGAFCYSQLAYVDTENPVTGGTPGGATPDHVLASRFPFTNAGGAPPAARIGHCNGSRAVYLGVYTDGAASLASGTGTAAVTVTARYLGPGGTDISLTMTTGGGALSVSVTGQDIVVTLAMAGSTANAVAAAINTAAGSFVTATGGGTGTVVAITKTYLSAAALSSSSNRCEYSLPRWPTMVPRQVVYHGGTNLSTFYPRPWEGLLNTGFGGAVKAAGHVGETFVVYTETSTWWLQPSPDGRLHPKMANPSIGCLSEGGAVSADSGVHAIGNGEWTLTHQQESVSLSHLVFGPTLDAILAANRSSTVGAYYAVRDEVWMACKTGTTPTFGTDILIWSERHKGIVSIFRPANLNGSYVTALCVYSTPTQQPIMLAALADGRILKWPGTAYTDAYAAAAGTDKFVGYACQWRGYFAQERRDKTEYLRRMDLHMRTNAGGITIGVTGMMTANEANASEETMTVTEAQLVSQSGMYFNRTVGSMYRVNITSTAGNAGWSAAELILHTTVQPSA